jgi:hypothetical protein
MLDRAALLAGHLQRENLADEREEGGGVLISLPFKVLLAALRGERAEDAGRHGEISPRLPW